jgi:hypothetical protein
MEDLDASPGRHGKTLGFDDSVYEAASFIDPKSLFVSEFYASNITINAPLSANFDETKFKRLGIAEDIIDFM